MKNLAEDATLENVQFMKILQKMPFEYEKLSRKCHFRKCLVHENIAENAI